MRALKGISTAIAIAGLCVGASLSAKASLFNLDKDYSSGGFGLPAGTIFGTVQLDQVDANTVSVLVTLNPACKFVHTGAGVSLGWDLLGSPAVTIQNLTPDFVQVAPPTVQADGTGKWDYAVDYTGGPGGSAAFSGPLSFSVYSAGGLTLSSFVANGQNLYFVSDIIANGYTGDIASSGPSPSPVPEPATVLAGALLLLPFGASAVRIIRKKS